jgi:probable rRNA maturation factor
MSKIIFEINNLTKGNIDKGFLEKVGKKVLKSLPRAKRAALNRGEISLVIVGEGRMRELNKKYRKKNKVTDVLAFDYGEIFICLSQAKKQAKKMGHSLKQELAVLLIHGILHLAGYKDETKKDFNKMLKKQEEVWQKII